MAKFQLLIMFLLLLPAADAICSYRNSLEKAAVDLNSAVFVSSITNVAVCGINASKGRHYELSDILEDGLSNALIRAGRFNVIMKNKQGEAMQEIKFGMDGYTDQMKAKKPGQMTQADALLTGTYRRHGSKITVDLQLVTVETSAAVWSGTIELSVSDFPKGSVPEEEAPEVVIQRETVYVDVPGKQQAETRMTEAAPKYIFDEASGRMVKFPLEVSASGQLAEPVVTPHERRRMEEEEAMMRRHFEAQREDAETAAAVMKNERYKGSDDRSLPTRPLPDDDEDYTWSQMYGWTRVPRYNKNGVQTNSGIKQPANLMQ